MKDQDTELRRMIEPLVGEINLWTDEVITRRDVAEFLKSKHRKDAVIGAFLIFKDLRCLVSSEKGIMDVIGNYRSFDNICDNVKVLLKSEFRRNHPNRKGKKWEDNECQILIGMYNEDVRLNAIAIKLQRTRGGVLGQLNKLGVVPDDAYTFKIKSFKKTELEDWCESRKK